MAKQTYDGIEIEVNDQGYLTNAGDWTPGIGAAIAVEVGIELTGAHRQVINFAREDFRGTDRTPGLRRIAANTDAFT